MAENTDDEIEEVLSRQLIGDGRSASYAKRLFTARKQHLEVVRTDDGMVIDGERYEHVGKSDDDCQDFEGER